MNCATGRPQSDQPRRDRPPAGRNPLPLFFASMAASLNGPRADGKQLLINFNFTDLGENHVLQVENAVLHHRIAAPVAGLMPRSI